MYPTIATIFKHLLALVVVVGMFGLIAYILPSTIDLTNSTVALFVGQIIGLIANNVADVIKHYFPRKDEK